ncbi:hypothetical protein V8C43DRAFT_45209 [Trichoderma afarasin]
MTQQPDNPRNTQQMNEAAIKELANIRDLLANVRDQLAQIANRMTTSEARAEERMQMQMLTRQLTNLSVQQPNLSLHQTNLDLLQRMQQLNSSLQRTNPSLQQTNLDLQLQRQMNMAQVQQLRIRALTINQGLRAQNTTAWCGGRPGGPFTPGRLAPLVSLSTGREIEGFPATFNDIAQINESDARRILAALEVATDGLSTAGMRDLIRSQVHYYPWMATR